MVFGSSRIRIKFPQSRSHPVALIGRLGRLHVATTFWPFGKLFYIRFHRANFLLAALRRIGNGTREVTRGHWICCSTLPGLEARESANPNNSELIFGSLRSRRLFSFTLCVCRTLWVFVFSVWCIQCCPETQRGVQHCKLATTFSIARRSCCLTFDSQWAAAQSTLAQTTNRSSNHHFSAPSNARGTTQQFVNPMSFEAYAVLHIGFGLRRGAQHGLCWLLWIDYLYREIDRNNEHMQITWRAFCFADRQYRQYRQCYQFSYFNL